MNRFPKATLAAAVSLAIGGPATVQAQIGNDSPEGNEKVLFPIVSTAPGTFTFITLVNDNFGDTEDHDLIQYKFTYMHKDWKADQLAGCTHQDFRVNVSSNFLLQFEAGLRAPIMPEVFAPANPSNLRPLGGFVGAQKNAFLVVEVVDEGQQDDDEVPDPFFGDDDDVHLFGEAVIVNLDNDLRWAYSTNRLGLQGDEVSQGEFPTNDIDFGELEGFEKNTSWYPEESVRTIWHVLPLGIVGEPQNPDADMLRAPGIRIDVTAETSDLDLDGKGAFGRDEVYFSGNEVKPIRCFGFFDRDDVTGDNPPVGTVTNDPVDLTKGGWMTIAGYNPGGESSSTVVDEVGSDLIDDSDPDSLTRGRSFLLHKIQYNEPVFGGVTIDENTDRVLGTIDPISVRHMVISREPERISVPD